MMCVGLLLGLLICEGIFRIIISRQLVDYPNPNLSKIMHRYAANSDLIYELKPSFSGKDGQIQIRTNSWGMRDKEYTLTKPRNTYRVAIIGDSVAFGYGLPLHLVFSERLEA